MNIPTTWKARVPALKALERPWHPVSRSVFYPACALYAVFLLQATRGTGILLLLDLVFIPIHEGGHLLFGWFGQFVGVAGGTALQLAVPALLAAHFTVQRDVQGTTFCIFTFFEQWLPISKYMADARAQALPLLTVGDSDVVIHDWNYLLTRCGCLAHDVQIAHVVHFVGWLGMLATIAWMVVQSLWATPSSAPPSGDPQATHGPAVA